MCSPRDFEWIAIEPSRNRNLVSASGHKLKHHGQQAVPMKLRDGRKIWITFQVCYVNGPIMSVGKFCTKGNDRCAIHHKWWHFVARRGWRDSGRQSAKPLRIRMLDHTSERVGTSANFRLQWKRRRTCRTSFDSPAESRCRDPDGCTAPRGRTHQERTKNTSNLRSFRQRRYQDRVSLARTRWKNTTCCMTLRCRGATSAFSRRAEMTFTDKQDRISFQ